MKTKIMAIVNLTPDSFYTESRFSFVDACNYIKKLETLGADIIDIGGESTRPGYKNVTIEEELNRVIPIIQTLKKETSIPISIDTQKPQVAKAAVEAGASWINDISGFTNPAMLEVAASYGVSVCTVHNEPLVKDENPSTQILRWFEKITAYLMKYGIKRKNIILDPGIGFGGKNPEDCFDIIQNLQNLKSFGLPLLLGLSRKSFMGKSLQLPASELLPATLAMNTLAIVSNVDYIRVHDVKEHNEVAQLLQKFKMSKA